ncbi:phage integrase SAM-like domain-containing protein [Tenacibaculum aiptasiae]|uniref:phage integrase SAM-like domain-containing protein n=1 Tax=Tenacibaculum aiptasiae TaxID=426481 RepID=UPI00232CA1CC|nr:phage integrase SAM-like domain-containing protein [Tenacibaculum aiptasiae]
MRGKIFLNKREGQQLKNGSYPLVCEITWEGKQKPFSLKMSFLKDDWDFKKQEPKKDKRKLLIVRRKKSLLDLLMSDYLTDNSIDFDYVKKVLTGKIEYSKDRTEEAKPIKVDFLKFGYELAKEKKQVINSKGILKEGNGESYITALNQLEKIKPKIDISEIDYKLLTDLKNSKLIQGVKKNSIAAYLRALKAIYNECIRRNKLKFEHNPFEGIFTGISTKKNRTRKRNLTKESIKILETLSSNLVEGQELAINLFLLQFYFGGQDLNDVYYLEKKQISKNNRIYFTRGKLDEGGYQFDLKIFPKSFKILNSFNSRDQFIINGRKDYNGYKNYIKRVNANLNRVQEKYNAHVKRIESITNKEYHKLEVMPLGGKITTKVARHTFSTIANRMYIEPDLLRSLMGHEREDVDTIYKDVYPEEERDKYHQKIISTSNVETVVKEIYCYEFINSNRKRSYEYKYFDKTPIEKKFIDKNSGKKFVKPKFFNKIYLIEK